MSDEEKDRIEKQKKLIEDAGLDAEFISHIQQEIKKMFNPEESDEERESFADWIRKNRHNSLTVDLTGPIEWTNPIEDKITAKDLTKEELQGCIDRCVEREEYEKAQDYLNELNSR